LGFPIIEALYGEEGLKTAILVDQPGSFVVLSTLGILVATIYSSGNPNGFQIAKRFFFSTVYHFFNCLRDEYSEF
jgi:predicted permease